VPAGLLIKPADLLLWLWVRCAVAVEDERVDSCEFILLVVVQWQWHYLLCVLQ